MPDRFHRAGDRRFDPRNGFPRRNEIFVGRHEVAELYLRTKRPIAFDAHTEIIPTGRFVIVDHSTCPAAASSSTITIPAAPPTRDTRAKTSIGATAESPLNQRRLRNGHSGCVVWLTGLSGSGKSTISMELERELFNLGRQTYVLDGDNVRHGLCSDLGFSPDDRCENIRRVGEVARLFAEAGVICITAFISPYRSDRELVRKLVPAGQFVEVHVNAPIETCEMRDTKGLYAKARAGEIKDFTGVSAPYEPPVNPELELRTDKLSVSESVAQVLDLLQARDQAEEISI
jgi:bifunctional enzyme CysN/CysC